MQSLTLSCFVLNLHTHFPISIIHKILFVDNLTLKWWKIPHLLVSQPLPSLIIDLQIMFFECKKFNSFFSTNYYKKPNNKSKWTKAIILVWNDNICMFFLSQFWTQVASLLNSKSFRKSMLFVLLTNERNVSWLKLEWRKKIFPNIPWTRMNIYKSKKIANEGSSLKSSVPTNTIRNLNHGNVSSSHQGWSITLLHEDKKPWVIWA